MKKIFKGFIKWFVRGTIYIWCKVRYRAKIVGLENIPKEGPMIFAGNHKSFLDAPLIIVTAKRDMRFLAKEELTNNLFLKFLIWTFDAIVVKRDNSDIGPVKESIKTLKNGGNIALFPEGTRNGLKKGEKTKDGVAFFALRSGAKVVPCGIKGGVKGDRKVTITYGKPLDFSEYKGSKDKEILDKVTNEIMKSILKLAK